MPVDAKDREHFAALDRRLVAAVKGVRLLESVSWPAAVQEHFLADWRIGKLAMPVIEYRKQDFSEVRAELEAVDRACDPDHPVGRYLHLTCESWRIVTRLLDAVGTHRVTAYSTRLFGRPVEMLPGDGPTNLEAAKHFIELADELDPELIGKAAASPSRIRLRTNTGFSEYDRNQLLMHEAFVHTLTGLNGRQQPVLGSMARGSPRTTATQEGLATLSEMMSGSMDIERMKRISLRICAIDKAIDGADFIEVFKFFIASGQGDVESFTSAQRIFRGVPTSGGAAFTKDTVYLHGLLSVHTFFRWCLRHRKLGLARELFAGKMALEDVFGFEALHADGTIAPAKFLPPWIQRANGLAGMLAFSLFANRIRLDSVDADDLVLGLA